MTQIAGAVGPVSKIANGNVNSPIMMDNQGNLLISEYHGRFYNAAYNGGIPTTMYSLCNQAAVTTTAALATTFTGLSVANPAGSGVNLEMLFFSVGQSVAATACAVGYMTGVGASAGSLIPRAAVVGQGPASRAIGSAGSTLGGTPVLEEVIGSTGSLATTGYGLQAGISKDIGGSLILPPGTFIASYTTIANSGLLFGFRWLEVPI